MGDWLRDAARYTAIYNTGRRVYNTLSSGARYVYDNWTPQQNFWEEGSDGSVAVAANQRAADDAFLKRAMGYRLNPAGLPAPSRSSRSSVGQYVYGLSQLPSTCSPSLWVGVSPSRSLEHSCDCCWFQFCASSTSLWCWWSQALF